MRWVKSTWENTDFYVMRYNVFEKIYYKLHDAYIENIKKNAYNPTPCVKQGGLYVNGKKA